MSEPTWARYLEFVNESQPPAKDLAFFTTIPWLQPYLKPSSPYRPIPFFSRIPKSTSEDKFFSKVINTPSTVSHGLSLVLKGDNFETRIADFADGKNGESATEEADFVYLVQLGSDLSGFEDTAHGGVLGALFDESMGACLERFRQTVEGRETLLFTANLSVSYRAPVDVPAVYAIKIWVERREGRKWFVKGELVGEDGKVKADAKALWISAKAKASL
ncbi:hypothetical protein BU24DRAFT_423313 [Aaosphaeria arxii CBS 175.79]|uniref:Thioesterase domain-containing protein n=1 Tax=Aaosphaeria arxii CBS 175.79 TaxID=1450172 RepID=A0A6A5XN54_9PLEO|nr:uncharacterized protein BU24DRAFT_423313 [Aaosphaeria arxii CBS 175.79]KAF2014326.1 hypothetical protein BU24DRAFT_423313 [Aaosphaeria arxii CBS 175.79]